jgi:hypothetical protein
VNELEDGGCFAVAELPGCNWPSMPPMEDEAPSDIPEDSVISRSNTSSLPGRGRHWQFYVLQLSST